MSPDTTVVATISSPDGLFQEDNDQGIFVEFDIRQKLDPIQQAKQAKDSHGCLVHCEYGDNISLRKHAC